jgi:hypothetical protein
LKPDTAVLDEVFDNYGSSSPLAIKKNIIQDCYKAANSEVNLAVQLVRKCFSRSERASSNCSGIGKISLSPTRLAAVKEALYSIYPIRPGQKEEDVWKMYRRAIDSSCRQLNRPTLTKRTLLF